VSVVEEAEVLLVYDKECPACDQYVRVMRVRESVGRFEIVDAREDTPVMREITEAGLDVDEGMVLKMGDTLYYGSDAQTQVGISGTFSSLRRPGAIAL